MICACSCNVCRTKRPSGSIQLPHDRCLNKCWDGKYSPQHITPSENQIWIACKDVDKNKRMKFLIKGLSFFNWSCIILEDEEYAKPRGYEIGQQYDVGKRIMLEQSTRFRYMGKEQICQVCRR